MEKLSRLFNKYSALELLDIQNQMEKDIHEHIFNSIVNLNKEDDEDKSEEALQEYEQDERQAEEERQYRNEPEW